MQVIPPIRMGKSPRLAAFSIFLVLTLPGIATEPVMLEAETTAVTFEPNPAMMAVDAGFRQLFEAAAPAVVVVEVERGGTGAMAGYDALQEFLFGRSPGEEPEGGWGETGAQGSGMLIRPDGYVLTNNHVLGKAGAYFVRLQDGTRLPARLVGRDDNTDIAVLKIEGADYPYLEFADVDQIGVGQLACAIGAPYALEYSLTVGWVSGVNRNKLEVGRWGANPLYEDYLQTDASINPGNSGGPLLDIRGRVLGMNTMIHGINTGLGFAIPADILKWTSDQLILGGRVSRPWLGISIETIRRPLRAHGGPSAGVLVKTVIPDAPAYLADVRADDVILEVDGQVVKTDRELQREIFYKRVGDPVMLRIWRNGNELHLPVTTSEMQTARLTTGQPARKTEPQEVPPVEETWGIVAEELDERLANRLGINRNERGLVIIEVLPDSPADAAELHAGDRIEEVGRVPVANLQEFRQALERAVEEADASRGIAFQCRRDGQVIESTIYSETPIE